MQMQTHYSYMMGPNGYRKPVNLFDLSNVKIERRREFVHDLIGRGHVLAKFPTGYYTEDLQELENHLNVPKD